jgi:uncharacterized protein involved in propanediol utilization
MAITIPQSLQIPAALRSVAAGGGHGFASSHHGEILQGVFETPDGRLHRGLITLKCNLFQTEASFLLDSSLGVQVDPVWKTKARQAAEMTLAYLDVPDFGGRLALLGSSPSGRGLGSSTSDVTAAIHAVAAALGRNLSDETIASLAVRSELASDSIMFPDRAVLFCQREGIVLEYFNQPLPPLDVAGFDAQPLLCIDTLILEPAQYNWQEIESFRSLIGLMRRAITNQDASYLGRVATASARINQRHLPKPRFDDLELLAEETGALGLQVAHSGTVMGLLFDSEDSQVLKRVGRARRRLSEMGFHQNWHFRTGLEQEKLLCETTRTILQTIL